MKFDYKKRLEKFSVGTIADAVRGADVGAVRLRFLPLIGAVLDVSGKVRKVVKRDGQMKLVIEPGDVPGFVVFADCLSDAENLTKPHIRKGSTVALRGRLASFGALAVCLIECRMKQPVENSGF